MRTQARSARSRTRAAIVAVLIALGVLVSVGVGHASGPAAQAPASAEQPDKKHGGDGGSKKSDNKKDGKKDGKNGKKDKAPPPAVEGPPCARTAFACVDLVSQRAWLTDGAGKVLRGPVPISSGKTGQETPTGTFSVLSKDKDHRSQEFDNAPMPYSVFFAAGGIALHGGSVTRQSAGCVHLEPADAQAFFDALQISNEVQVR